MATLVNVSTKERENKLRELTASGAKSLAGGLQLPEGVHTFTVAEKKPFGFLEVESAASGKWVLPIVAGTMTVGKEKIAFELSAEPGAKTLVIPDNFYLAMVANGQYAITIESRKGRKVVTNVEPADALKPANADEDED
jgi:hypothetical protein